MLNNINKKIAIHSLQLEVTNRCNLNCPHCFQYENNEKGIYYNDIMDTEVIEHLFNDMGIVRIMNLNFTGGEPLLAEDKIIYVLNKIMNGEAKVFCIDIATNGTILSEKFALKLNDCANYLFEHIENTIREEIDRKENKSIQFRISNAYHGNQAEEAYQFYKKRMPDVSVKIMDDNENVILGYSGRAKNLQSDFFAIRRIIKLDMKRNIIIR